MGTNSGNPTMDIYHARIAIKKSPLSRQKYITAVNYTCVDATTGENDDDDEDDDDDDDNDNEGNKKVAAIDKTARAIFSVDDSDLEEDHGRKDAGPPRLLQRQHENSGSDCENIRQSTRRPRKQYIRLVSTLGNKKEPVPLLK
jgi:hypothetical protein